MSSRPWQLGRRALEIDPENSAAQRLVQRLEEVRAYRGEPPVSVAAPPAPEPVPVTAPRPEPMPAPGPAPETQQAPAPDAPTVAAPVEAPPRARSWLDRVLRRNR